jgi:DinB family
LLRACEKLTREEYEAPRVSFFPSIPATLNHILIVDWYYVDALFGEKKGRALESSRERASRLRSSTSFSCAKRSNCGERSFASSAFPRNELVDRTAVGGARPPIVQSAGVRHPDRVVAPPRPARSTLSGKYSYFLHGVTVAITSGSMNPGRSIIASVSIALVLVLASSGGGAQGSENARDREHAPRASFRRDVAPVLAQSCSTRSCHGGGRSPMLHADENASKLRAALVGVQSEEHATHAYVRPGDPDASYLVEKIEGHLVHAQCADHDCGERMPLDNPALPENARRAIRAWIADGAPDN